MKISEVQSSFNKYWDWCAVVSTERWKGIRLVSSLEEPPIAQAHFYSVARVHALIQDADFCGVCKLGKFVRLLCGSCRRNLAWKCRPDQAPPDFLLFPQNKRALEGHLFDSIVAVQAVTTKALNSMSETHLQGAIHE